MLVLTRKLMEKLYIGNDVCVTVVRLEGGQVRLGIDAPRDVAVIRAELIDGREPSPRVHDEPKGSPPPPLSFKTRPSEARGIGIRRRGPSQ
jgi:carbon storage regulator